MNIQLQNLIQNKLNPQWELKIPKKYYPLITFGRIISTHAFLKS
jgi:hypothetical protein